MSHAAKTTSLPLTLILLGAVGSLPAGAASDGETLHQTHCLQCHGSEVYTRADRKITAYPALESQVQRCEQSLELKWFDEDTQQVASFLNERFYHFSR